MTDLFFAKGEGRHLKVPPHVPYSSDNLAYHLTQKILLTDCIYNEEFDAIIRVGHIYKVAVAQDIEIHVCGVVLWQHAVCLVIDDKI